nr:MAG: hypothetical protein [Microvirus Sku28]
MTRKENNPFIGTSSLRPCTDFANSYAFQPFELSDLCVQIDSSDESVHICSDIEVLIMEQDFLSRHPEYAERFLKQAAESMGTKDEYAELRALIPDDELLDYCKSRRFQSPAEMQLYGDMLAAEYRSRKESFNDLVSKEILKRKSEAELLKSSESVEPTKPTKD